MDKKDEIILRQLDVIRAMSQNALRRPERTYPDPGMYKRVNQDGTITFILIK